MLGSALVRRLVQSPGIEKIYAIVRKSAGEMVAVEKRKRLPVDARISLIECELQDYARLADMINDDCDVFYHFAWPRTATYEESTQDVLLKCDAVKGLVEAVNTAKELKCRKFVGAGSQSEYGGPEDGYYSVDRPCNPVRIDGALHLAAGQIGRLLAEKQGMTFIWMRIFSVYGVNDRENSMINSTIDKLLAGEHCSFTKSEQTWDYIYEDDVAEAFYLVGEKIAQSKVYNVASGNSRPLKDYINCLRDIVAPQAVLGIGERPYPANPIMKMEVDVAELQNDTGWLPGTAFDEGIKHMLAVRLEDGTEKHGK